MTSGKFDYIQLSDITVSEDRQRKDFNEKSMESLVDSISRRGLIHPIVVTQDFTLVAGERRLRAHEILGFEQIAAQFVEDLSPEELALIELEENIKRTDLTWQEENNAIAAFHKVKKEMEPDWSQTATAGELGISESLMARHMLVHSMRNEGVKEVDEAPKFSAACSYAERVRDRKKASDTRDVTAAIKDTLKKPTTTETPDNPDTPSAAPDRFSDIQQANFHEWSAQPRQTKFNFIHCDFPYGIDATKIGQSAAKTHGGYEDEAETYWKLLETFRTNLDNFCAPSAHMIFWFSMNYYTETKEFIESMGFRVFLPLLIWGRSDNRGILADKDRVARNISETALLCSRDDRKLVQSKSNIVWSATTKDYHMSEKPHAVLSHFLKMVVDETSIVLDPTAGSGMAIKVSEELGAAYSLGLELNPDYVTEARRNLGYE